MVRYAWESLIEQDSLESLPSRCLSLSNEGLSVDGKGWRRVRQNPEPLHEIISSRNDRGAHRNPGVGSLTPWTNKILSAIRHR